MGSALGVEPARAQTGRYIVSVESDGEIGSIENAADEHYRTTPLGDVTLVTGHYSAEAIDTVESRDDVLDVEIDREGSLPPDPPDEDGEYPHPTASHGSAGPPGSGDDPVDNGDQVTDWGFDLLGGHYLVPQNVDGDGVTVAVLDSGFDVDHPGFEGNIAHTSVFSGQSISETPSHGTATAGVIGARNDTEGSVGIAPEVDLALGKIGSSTASWSDIAEGVRWAVEDVGAQVINLSYSGPNSRYLDHVVRYARDNDVVFVSSAGNDGLKDRCQDDDCVNYPSAHELVVSVSALHRRMDLAEFSSTGPEVDVTAPGESVTTLSPTGQDAEVRHDFAGTSFAAPYVAGVAALVYQTRPDSSANEVIERLTDGAIDLGLPQSEQGHGRIDSWRAVASDQNWLPTVTNAEWNDDQSASRFDVNARANSIYAEDEYGLIEPYFVAYFPANRLEGDEGVEDIWNEENEEYEQWISVGQSEPTNGSYDHRVIIEIGDRYFDRIEEDGNIEVMVILMDSDLGLDDEIERWTFRAPYASESADGIEGGPPTATPTPTPSTPTTATPTPTPPTPTTPLTTTPNESHRVCGGYPSRDMGNLSCHRVNGSGQVGSPSSPTTPTTPTTATATPTPTTPTSAPPSDEPKSSPSGWLEIIDRAVSVFRSLF